MFTGERQARSENLPDRFKCIQAFCAIATNGSVAAAIDLIDLPRGFD